MPKAVVKTFENPTSSAQKLVNSAVDLWEKQGSSGISTRAIAQNAGLPVSAIYYYFGDLERLLESAQTDSIAAAKNWCDAILDAIRGPINGIESLGPFLSTIIDDWCEKQRPLAFAERECQSMALRDSKYQNLCRQWFTLWGHFWDDICHRLNLPASAGRLTAYFFDGVTALHLMRWRRPVDRAALEELCRAWAGWLDGRINSSNGWHELARAEAITAMPAQPEWDEATEAIATSCAAVIDRLGVSGLTHRAVAADAGITLGMVSHKFRTSADLLRAAFETIYRRLINSDNKQGQATAPATAKTTQQLLESGLPPQDQMLATYELMAASARHSEFQAFAAQLRYLRGRTSGVYLQLLLGPDRPITALDATIFSCWQSGRIRYYRCGGTTPLNEAGKPTEIAQILAFLRP